MIIFSLFVGLRIPHDYGSLQLFGIMVSPILFLYAMGQRYSNAYITCVSILMVDVSFVIDNLYI